MFNDLDTELDNYKMGVQCKAVYIVLVQYYFIFASAAANRQVTYIMTSTSQPTKRHRFQY